IVRGKTTLKAEVPQGAADKTGSKVIKQEEDNATTSAPPPERTVQPSEIQRAYSFGGEQVTFSPEELKQLRNFGPPVIRVLGFKALADLPFWANIKPATFVFPTETGYAGSTRTFAALWQVLLRREMWALTWFIARANANPRLAALIAARERPAGAAGGSNSAGSGSANSDGGTIPAGMWLIPLPFVDDIRPNPAIAHVPAPQSLVDRMSVVVQQLLLPGGSYAPARYPNPALQYHYKIVQAIALDEELPAPPPDRTLPKYKQIDRRAGPYVLEWADELKRLHGEMGLDRRDERQAATWRPPAKIILRTSVIKVKLGNFQ
ncbi:ATP-dependent DNA helicase II subunit 1, partial [Ascosphaera acerosa]